MGKKNWIALVTIFMLAIQIVPLTTVRGATDTEDGLNEDFERKTVITVRDVNNYSYDTTKGDPVVKSGEEYEKSFNDSMGNPPVLQGNTVLTVDIAKDESIESVEYAFVKDGATVAVKSGNIDVDTKSALYPDVEKAKLGYMKAQHYDVSRLPKYNNNENDPNLKVWRDREQVFMVPVSQSTVYKKASVAANFNQYFNIIDKVNGIFDTNTVFLAGFQTNNDDLGNGGIHTEASKFWGYIKFPKAGTYYIGAVADDGSKVMLIDDRPDSPNKSSITDGNEIILNDDFTPHWYKFETSNKQVVIREQDLDSYFPIYMEYFNYGDNGQFMLISSFNTPFAKKTALHDGNGVKLDNIGNIKNSLGMSGKDVSIIPEGWFCPSKSDDPASEPTAKFQSTAKDGIQFPTEDGEYYVKITETMTDGTKREIVLGPFIIDTTAPDGRIEHSPDCFTKGHVDLQFIRNDVGSSVVLKVKTVSRILTDGTEDELVTPDALVETYKYRTSYNGNYMFTITASNRPDTEFKFYKVVDNIDRVAPDVTPYITPVAGSTTHHLITLDVKDIPGNKDTLNITVSDGYHLYSASGELELVSAKKKLDGSSVAFTQVSYNNKDAVWTVQGEIGATYEFIFKDQVVNQTIMSVFVPLSPVDEKPINNVSLDFTTIDKTTIGTSGSLKLVDKGRFQAVLSFNTAIDVTTAPYENGTVTVKFEPTGATNFKIVKIVGSGNSWVTIGSDYQSLVFKNNGIAMGVGDKKLTLTIDIGEGPSVADAATPSITIDSIELTAVNTMLVPYVFDDGDVYWASGANKELKFTMVKNPVIR